MMKFFIPTKQRAQAVEILRNMQERLEIDDDYLGSCIQERDYPCSHIVYAEHWRSEAGIYEHIRSSLYRRVLAVIELSCRAPEVSFYFVSHKRGLELIQELRGQNNQKAADLNPSSIRGEP